MSLSDPTVVSLNSINTIQCTVIYVSADISFVIIKLSLLYNPRRVPLEITHYELHDQRNCRLNSHKCRDTSHVHRMHILNDISYVYIQHIVKYIALFQP